MRRHPAIAAATALPALALLCSGCQTLGPASLAAGRGTYTEVIARTNAEQALNILVSIRYAEPATLLTVTNIAASMKFSARIGGEAGIGPQSTYAGNLVPLSMGVAYEDNPTISYAPVDGQAFLDQWLAPVSLQTVTLVLQSSLAADQTPLLIISRINGLRGGATAPEAERMRFARAIELLCELRRGGAAAWVVGAADPAKPATGELLLSPTTEADWKSTDEAIELLGLGTRADLVREGVIRLPLVLGFRTPGFKGIAIETRSVAEVMGYAAASIEVPQEHLESGVALQQPTVAIGSANGLRIRCTTKPPEHAAVSIQRRGYWYWIDDQDFASKRTFKDLQTLFQTRVAQATKGAQSVPILTIPVGH
ncbi:MAG: hypothetical protein U0625_11815 [Phycisphaerales bacterium]